MACLLQLECNFLHGFFRCKLPVEVVDMEVKVTSMQGTHIFKRDRTTQLTKCIPWTMKIHPHPTIIKKMKTFLEVENKMGLMIPIPAPNSQFRPPLPETNPNVCIRMTIQIKEKELHPKGSSNQLPLGLPRHALPCPKLHQNPVTICHQHKYGKTLHGQVLARHQAIYSKTGTGYSQKAT